MKRKGKRKGTKHATGGDGWKTLDRYDSIVTKARDADKSWDNAVKLNAISEATENNMVLEGNKGREESDSANVPQDGGPAGFRGIRVVPI